MSNHGILLVDKPAGPTSNAVLGRTKHLLGIRKAGHTGTLDPFATGLLVFCFGEATKISGYLLDDNKTYRATVRLGASTTTGDPEGEIIARAALPALDAGKLESTLRRFTGEIEQIPPMHSALKHQGKRLYELAREGKTVARKPRRVTIHGIGLDNLALPCFTISVNCSKGTYIRTLATDIGEHLGCGAHLTALRRTASGPFRLDQAITMEALAALPPEQRRALLLPIDAAFPDWPALELDQVQTRRFRHGQKLPGFQRPSLPTPALVKQGERLLGIGEIQPDGVLKPARLFNL